MKKISIYIIIVMSFFSFPVRGNELDYSNWNRILRKHVNEQGWIDYQGLKRNSLVELEVFVNALSQTDPSQLKSDKHRKAFWINAYNVLVIWKLIQRGMPSKVPLLRFFKEKNNLVGGRNRSLDEIEHDILRKGFKDPRIHAVLVCGASSCPRLRNEPFRAGKLEKQLDEETRYWLNLGKDRRGRRKNYFDPEHKTYYASKIFKWYNEDFGNSHHGILKFIYRYTPENKRGNLRKHGIRVAFLDYDWSLNRQ